MFELANLAEEENQLDAAREIFGSVLLKTKRFYLEK